MLGSIPHQKFCFIIYLLEDEQELSLGMLIRLHRIYNFYCSMPIFYNFHILFGNFYIIFGTNILIQCPVPVPVCCMFFVSQKPNIKRNPNGIKMDRELFWNIWDFPEEESTRNGARGVHKTGARLPPSWATCKAVDILLLPQES